MNQTGGPPAKRHCLNGANSPTTNSSTPHYHDQDYNNSQWYPFSKPKPTLPTNETIQIVAECREFWSCQNNQQRNDLLPSCKHSTQSVVKPIQSTQHLFQHRAITMTKQYLNYRRVITVVGMYN